LWQDAAVTASPDPSLAARALGLARRGLMRPSAPAALPARLLVVDAERQLAVWLEDGKAAAPRSAILSTGSGGRCWAS